MSFLSLLVLPVALAADDDAPKFPIVKPSGVVFMSYLYDLTDGSDGYNTFSVDRVYVRTDVTFNKHFGSRVTFDADRAKPPSIGGVPAESYDTKYRVFVKHAYLEVRDLGPLKLRAGMIETAFAPYYDNFVGHRYIGKSFTDANGILDTADLGVQIAGKHLNGLLDWNVSAINGEGYSKVEVDAGKTGQARLTVNPLASVQDRQLPITAFVSYGGRPSTDSSTLVASGAVGFKMPRFIAWAELDYQSEMAGGSSVNGLGYSATLNPRMPKYLGVIARYDHWDPDGATSGDEETTLLAGLEKDFMDKVSVALTYERSWADAAPDAASHGIVVRAQAGF